MVYSASVWHGDLLGVSLKFKIGTDGLWTMISRTPLRVTGSVVVSVNLGRGMFLVLWSG